MDTIEYEMRGTWDLTAIREMIADIIDISYISLHSVYKT